MSSVKSVPHVAAPPAKPLMVYDGDCNFCMMWIRRWQCATGDHVEYLPLQDPQIATRFPEIPAGRFEAAVQLLELDGSVYSGAEAVFRSLAHNPHEQWLLELYRRTPAFARFSDWSYRFVARHRKAFSFLTRLLWGPTTERPSHVFVRWAFLRSLGIIYLIAFVSLWVQIIGLAGSNGIVPVQSTIDAAKQHADAMKANLNRYHWTPTLSWFNPSDGFLKFQCAAGVLLALLVAAGIAPAPCLFLLWLIYLSLSTVCNVFLAFQWDVLLLETGFLAIFFAPWQWLPRGPSRERPPSRLALWLLRWLLFRLMFESGVVKLLSHDPTWRTLTALNFHFETQPLPTWIGWYVHQLPAWIHKSDTFLMFVIELAVPFLIFFPRRPRQFACLAFLALQLFILLTGNYAFFNLLTMVLCLTLLDDAALQRCLPRKWRCDPQHFLPATTGWRRKLRLGLTLALVAVVLSMSFVQLCGLYGMRPAGRHPVFLLYQWLQPFRTFNSYGLFAVMTTARPEIVVEGSNDGVNWEAYAFRYKPGDLKQRPRFVAPHQPRLDWQMWFAALGRYEQNPWFVNFCTRLLQGSPEVLALMERNPFPNAPPRYIRAVVYQYHFTDFPTRRATGQWWRRELKGLYLPPISLRENGT